MPTAKKTRRANLKRKSIPTGSALEHDDSPGVTALFAAMTHPLKPTLQAVRRTILTADPSITEGIKWNSPSFYCCGWFATLRTRDPKQVDLVLHCGAKVRVACTVKGVIDDTDHLLTWPSTDRALMSFKSDADLQAKQPAFRRIIQQWVAYQKSYAGVVPPLAPAARALAL